MPRVVDYEDEYVEVTVALAGFRKHKVLSWIPFSTGCRPRIAFRVSMQQNQHELKEIAVDSYSLDVRSRGLSKANHDWSARDPRPGIEYKITLPRLSESGSYEYRISILVQCAGTEGPRCVGGRIMSTGRVSSLDNAWAALAGLSKSG
jgi:hypothetical protein